MFKVQIFRKPDSVVLGGGPGIYLITLPRRLGIYGRPLLSKAWGPWHNETVRPDDLPEFVLL